VSPLGVVVAGIRERFAACDPCVLGLPAVAACILEGGSLCEWGVNSSSEGRAYGTYCGKGKDGGELGDGLGRPPNIIKGQSRVETWVAPTWVHGHYMLWVVRDGCEHAKARALQTTRSRSKSQPQKEKTHRTMAIDIRGIVLVERALAVPG
jgi:hypothetical protein